MIYDTNTGTKIGVREKAKQIPFVNAIRFFIIVLAFVD